MSLGTITGVAAVGQEGGPIFVERVTIVGDDSYPTGGTTGAEALIQAALGKGSVEILAAIHQGPVASDFALSYDKAADTLVARVWSTGAQVGNSVDLSGVTFEMLIIAK